jgi:pro-apoptotic serine protease NMA111
MSGGPLALPAGAGVIVHLDERIGLVLVDRNTVCIAAGDFIVSFCAFPSEAPAAVRFLHPLQNWAIVSFDTADLPLEVSVVP